MAVSKSMDFPGGKKSSYAAQVEQSQASTSTENVLSFLPVPGPVGPQGPAGRDGRDGSDGKEGLQGPEGKIGPRGPEGRDGLSSLSSSGQQSGWASYHNKIEKPFKLGISEGDDGWVTVFVLSEGLSNEKYLPKDCASLLNDHAIAFNFKGLN